MSHNDFLRPYNLILPTTVLSGGDFEFADTMSVEGLQGDNGGTFAPKTPIGVGGAGFLFNECSIQGGVRTGGGGRLVLGDSDYPTFPGRTRTTALAFATHMGKNPGSYQPTLGGVVSTAPDGVTSTAALNIPIPQRLLQNGATIATVTLSMRVGRPHPAVPPTVPSLFMYRIAKDGTSAATASGPASFATPATGAIWWANGQKKTLVFTPTANNVVDFTQYSFLLSITDELGGAGALGGDLYISASIALTGIVDMRP